MKKLYKFESEKSTGVVGINVDIDNKTLKVSQVKGGTVDLNTFLQILESDKDFDIMTEIKYGYERQNPYKIICHEGMSGSLDYYIEWIEGYADVFPITRRKHIFHISMYDKLNEGVDVFIPDFILLLPELRPYWEETYFVEIPIIDPAEYIDPNTPPTTEDFVPGMGWQSKKEFLQSGIQAGIDEYMKHPQYLSEIYTEYILCPSEYSALKKAFTKGKTRHKDYDLYENENDTVFIHVCHNEKVTSVVLNSMEVAA